ncbi:hypothetical protein MESS2_1350030 [Mesorhizobium metallidurans STM 2683]|uniref:Uncharacterized protein n=1 Tax=Mesorhizobium metallidurans STM 2683 TaxID=1297569 RepID=M5EJ13_9HYPH|nr:hypothetical protein MESS2_1350030 [Mesorhizobium metallidurans STM 2683]
MDADVGRHSQTHSPAHGRADDGRVRFRQGRRRCIAFAPACPGELRCRRPFRGHHRRQDRDPGSRELLHRPFQSRPRRQGARSGSPGRQLYAAPRRLSRLTAFLQTKSRASEEARAVAWAPCGAAVLETSPQGPKLPDLGEDRINRPELVRYPYPERIGLESRSHISQ